MKKDYEITTPTFAELQQFELEGYNFEGFLKYRGVVVPLFVVKNGTQHIARIGNRTYCHNTKQSNYIEYFKSKIDKLLQNVKD